MTLKLVKLKQNKRTQTQKTFDRALQYLNAELKDVTAVGFFIRTKTDTIFGTGYAKDGRISDAYFGSQILTASIFENSHEHVENKPPGGAA